jgi:fumarate reductase subunit D
LELGRNCEFAGLILGQRGFRVFSVKSKQLANVLIKILGLSICFYAIPTCVSGIIFAVSFPTGLPKTDETEITVVRFVSSAVGAGIEVLFGIIIIAMSRKIAGWMFKSDED